MIVSKGKFAQMVGRSAGAVSQWIAAGKLHGPALIGKGRAAQIDAEIAAAQLGYTLDLGQQLAQTAPLLPALPDGEESQDDQRRRLKIRAEREELALELERAAALEKSGAWMATAEAEAAWSAELASLRRAVESWLVTDAAEACLTLASRGGADRRAFAVALRQGWDALCGRLSSAPADESGGAP